MTVPDEPTQTVVQADPHRDPAPVDDHPFRPRDKVQAWGLCGACGYAQASHASTVHPYRTTSRRAA